MLGDPKPCQFISEPHNGWKCGREVVEGTDFCKSHGGNVSEPQEPTQYWVKSREKKPGQGNMTKVIFLCDTGEWFEVAPHKLELRQLDHTQPGLLALGTEVELVAAKADGTPETENGEPKVQYGFRAFITYNLSGLTDPDPDAQLLVVSGSKKPN